MFLFTTSKRTNSYSRQETRFSLSYGRCFAILIGRVEYEMFMVEIKFLKFKLDKIYILA